jgi:hypothetical protein
MQCPGKFVLQNFNEQDQIPAVFFLLGTRLHEAIEVAINMDLDEDWALRHINAAIDRDLEQLDAAPLILESSKRGVDSMREDATRMLRQWYRTVHPDSRKRLGPYSKMNWPPQTEVEWMRLPDGQFKYPVWGSCDAVFTNQAGEPVIVDWKSGSSRQRSSDQIHFYMFGYGAREGWFHHLDRIQERSVIQHADPYPGDEAIVQRIVAVESIKESVVAGSYPRFVPDWHCNWCPVRTVCPADGDVRNRDANADALRRALRLAKPLVAA